MNTETNIADTISLEVIYNYEKKKKKNRTYAVKVIKIGFNIDHNNIYDDF